MLSQTEIERDEKYVFRPDYYHLKALTILLNEKNVSNTKIIAFLKKYDIDLNCQIPVRGVQGTYVPLVYHCLLDKRYEKTLKYLISENVDLKQLPNADKINEILFVCNRHYLFFLKNNNVTLVSNKENLVRQIEERILQGEVKRIYDLQYLKLLSENIIMESLKDETIMSKLFINVLNKIAVICNTTNEKDEVDKVILNYKNTVKFLLNNGFIIDNVILQNVVNMYLVEIVKTILEHYPEKKWNIHVQKHKEMNKFKTAYMRQLFNDYNQECLINLFKSDNNF
jgi:hypothetical protein